MGLRDAVRLTATQRADTDLNSCAGNAMLSQLKSLALVKGKKHIVKIQHNILIAAMSLNYMWSSDDKECPDLPEKMGGLLQIHQQ